MLPGEFSLHYWRNDHIGVCGSIRLVEMRNVVFAYLG
jgi:hypothetical protein